MASAARRWPLVRVALLQLLVLWGTPAVLAAALPQADHAGSFQTAGEQQLGISSAAAHGTATQRGSPATRLLLGDGRGEGAARRQLTSAANSQTSVVYAASNAGLRPTKFTAYLRRHFYQVPENPVGTVVFFAGCARSSRTFWPYDPRACDECLGFPEEVAMTKMALARGYAVLTPTAKARNSCWSSAGYYRRNDQMQVMHIITDFVQLNKLDQKPIYLVGASSGATFALKIPAYLHRFATADRWVCSNDPSPDGTPPPPTVGPVKCRDPYERWDLPTMDQLRLLQRQIKGIVSVGSTPEPASWGIFKPNSSSLAFREQPPVVWLAMANDTWGMIQAPQNVKRLRSNRIPSTWVVSAARQVTTTFFSERSPVITAEQSALVVGGLKQIGLLDENGWLTSNPKTLENRFTTAYQWPEKLIRVLPWLTMGKSKTFSLDIYNSLIFQELNVAYGYHETVADHLTAMLAWLEARGMRYMPRLKWVHRVQPNLASLTAQRYYTDVMPQRANIAGRQHTAGW